MAPHSIHKACGCIYIASDGELCAEVGAVGKLGLMLASTDWLDGLNKMLREWDLRYYQRHCVVNTHYNNGVRVRHLEVSEADVANKISEAAELRAENTTLKSELQQLQEFTRSVL